MSDAGLRFTARVALGAVLLLALVLAVRQLGSHDLGFHLKAGDRVLSGDGWPDRDTFTYTVNDRSYLDTSWGFQVVVALVERIGGPATLSLFGAAVVLGVLLALLATVRLAPADPLVVAALLLPAVLACEIRFEVRPEWFSYALLAALLYLLHRHGEGRAVPLWLLPLLHLVWANVHSLWVLGWAALGCFAAGLWLRDRRVDRPIVAWSAVSVLAVLVNPYGWRAVAFTLSLATRLRGDNPFAREIGELFSIFQVLGRPSYTRVPIWSFVLVALAAIVALVPLARARRWPSVLLTVVFLPLASGAVRNVPLLVVACLPGMAWAFSDLWRRLIPSATAGRRIRAVSAAIVALVALVASLRVVHDGYYVANRRTVRFGVGWNRLVLPVDAAEWARRVDPGARMLNDLGFGGYLMWAVERPVFVDSRLEVMGEAFFDEYRGLFASDAALAAGARRWGYDWIVVPHRQYAVFVQRMARNPAWELAYVDPLAVAWVRRDARAASKVDASARRIASGPHGGVHPDELPGLGGGPRAAGLGFWLEGLWRRQVFPTEDYRIGNFHYFRGEIGNAMEHFTAAIAESRGAYVEIYNNLGAMLQRTGNNERARRCFQVVLDARPDDAYAAEQLRELD